MRALSEADFEREASAAFRRVFADPNPFGAPFAAAAEARAVLFPVHYVLTSQVMAAVVAAAEGAGDAAFYLSILERPDAKSQDRPYHWHIEVSDVAAYSALTYPFVLENAIYSPRGVWGILFSHERHALLGASRSFMDILDRRIRGVHDQVNQFLQFWKANRTRFGSAAPWLPAMMRHIYGDERAGELLKAADLG